MREKPNSSNAAARLRRLAEARLREGTPHRRPPAGGPRAADPDTQRDLHELQVHQVELEMQNAELREARDQLESIVERYTELYDFAPVGYFSLDEQDRIMEVNLTAAAMLGVERSRLIHRRLASFVAPKDRASFLAFLKKFLDEAETQVCEATLCKEDGTPFWACIHATGNSVNGPKKWRRLAVSDITAVKDAEEAQNRLDALSVASSKLKQEIVRRQALEGANEERMQLKGKLLQQSRTIQEQLRTVSHRVLQAQEDERKRISRELHDEIIQTLVSINVDLETLARDPEINPKRLRQRISRTQRLVQNSVAIVHKFATDLRPAALDDLGLIPAIRSLLRGFMKRTNIRTRFNAPGGVEGLPGDRRAVLYRVAQSALANVAQHARASMVTVTIRKVSKAVSMEVSDNGISFDVNEVFGAKRRKNLGLIGMRERVEMVGGDFSIESAPGQGTTIRARIPLPPV